MPTRQYIGARYVPKFFDNNGSSEWVSGLPYEALTIVTRLGNSYTSKIPVPSNIGAPESNPTYWASTGNFNEQIESIREEVEESNLLSQTKWVFIGESTCLENGSNSATNTIPKRIATCLKLADEDWVQNCVANRGFTTNNSFQNMLQATVANLDNDFKNSNVRVVVFGGILNDYESDIATCRTAMNTFATYARSVFPKLSLEYVQVGWSKSPADKAKIRQRTEDVIRLVQSYGWKVWWEFDAFAHDYANWFYDNRNFNATGISWIGQYCANMLAGCSAVNNTPVKTASGATGLTDGISAVNYYRLACSMVNILVNIKGYFTITFSAERTLDLPTNADKMLANEICDNPFQYVTPGFEQNSTETYDKIVYYTGIDGYLRYVDNGEAYTEPILLYIDANNKLSIATYKAFTIPASTVRITVNGMLPREYC